MLKLSLLLRISLSRGSIIDHVLDDTGSELLELYEEDDCARTGLYADSKYTGWRGPIDLDTVIARFYCSGLHPFVPGNVIISN